MLQTLKTLSIKFNHYTSWWVLHGHSHNSYPYEKDKWIRRHWNVDTLTLSVRIVITTTIVLPFVHDFLTTRSDMWMHMNVWCIRHKFFARFEKYSTWDHPSWEKCTLLPWNSTNYCWNWKKAIYISKEKQHHKQRDQTRSPLINLLYQNSYFKEKRCINMYYYCYYCYYLCEKDNSM